MHKILPILVGIDKNLIRDVVAKQEIRKAVSIKIGDFYFNSKEYEKALTYYDMAPATSGPAR